MNWIIQLSHPFIYHQICIQILGCAGAVLGSGDAKAHLARSLKATQGEMCKENRIRQGVESVRSEEGIHRGDAFWTRSWGVRTWQFQVIKTSCEKGWSCEKKKKKWAESHENFGVGGAWPSAWCLSLNSGSILGWGHGDSCAAQPYPRSWTQAYS